MPKAILDIKLTDKAKGLLALFLPITIFCLVIWAKAAFRKMEPNDLDASWSPDGESIVYVCYKQEKLDVSFAYAFESPYNGPYGYYKAQILKEICVSDVFGENGIKITDDLNIDDYPSWSPNSSNIVYFSNSDQHLYVVERDGSGIRRVTETPMNYHTPLWSPDGEEIAAVANFAGDVYLVQKDGENFHQLTNIAGITWFDWSRNGDLIYFTTDSQGSEDVFYVDVENQEIVNLTNSPEHESYVSLSSDGSYISYSIEWERSIVNLETGEEIEIGDLSSFAWFSQGSDYSYLLTDPYRTYQFFVISTIEGEILEKIELNIEEYGLAYKATLSPNGGYLLLEYNHDWNGDGYHESKIMVMELSTGEQWYISFFQ